MRRTSRIASPSATAIETEKNGMPRFAFSEPSIGSITTRQRPPPTSPISSETIRVAEAGEPRDDDALSRLVDRRRLVAALARADDRLARFPRVGSSASTARTSSVAARQTSRPDQSSGYRSSPEVSLGRSRSSSASLTSAGSLEDRVERRRPEQERGRGFAAIDGAGGLAGAACT